DPLRRAKACPAVGAAREHHVGSVAAGRSHAGQHVNVIVRRAAGAVNHQEYLPCKSAWINGASVNQAAPHVDCRDLIKCWRDSRVLCVARPNAPKTATRIPAADEKIAVAGHVKCSPLRRVGNTDRSLPGGPVVGGTAESAEIASEELGPELVLETVAHAGGYPVDREPFLVAA